MRGAGPHPSWLRPESLRPDERVRGAGRRPLERQCREQGSGFRVQGSGFRVQGSGFRVLGFGFWVFGSGFRVQGLEFRAEGFGFTFVEQKPFSLA